mmetsp:Transcript_30468/g.83452  ORF Transcript_30468/g.83452 Transcript_30468/m.83452 type:complete len:385 (+) Transcript_30468:431-1585(+)
MDTLRYNESSADAGNDEGDDPAEGGLAEDELVHTLRALEQGDAGRGANLAVGGGERKPNVRSNDDHNRRTKLDGEAAGGSDDGQLDSNGLNDLVSVKQKADADAGTADREDPVGIVAHVGLLLNLGIVDVRGVDGHERTHGVGHVVGAVREGVADSGENLNVAEHGLRLRVELLSVGVDLLDSGGRILTVAHLVHVTVHGKQASVLDSQARLIAAGRLSRLLVACLTRSHLGLRLGRGVGDALVRELLLDVGADLRVGRDEYNRGDESDTTRHGHGNPAVDLASSAVANPDLVALGADLLRNALRQHEEGVDPNGCPDEAGVKRDGAAERVGAAEHKTAHDQEEDDGEDAGEDGRDDPGENNARDAARNVQLVGARLLVPHDTV